MAPSTIITGLSWGHRRASGPLLPLSRRFSEIHPNIEVRWSDRTLAGFEHQNIKEAASAFDMIIYDHPFSGDIAAGEILVDLGSALPDQLGPANEADFIGPSLASYRFGGGLWGAPIDAATEHAVYRADLLQDLGATLPRRWDEVIELGRLARAKGLFLGLAHVTPHAGLLVAALMANRGRPWTTDPAMPFAIDEPALAETLRDVADLAQFSPPESRNWNSIDLHEAMVARDDIVYAPCVYGYATYGEADMRRRLSFADFPGPLAPHAAGSAIGGTALGISAKSANRDAALDFVRFVLTHEAQANIIPAHHGQPALRSAWSDPAIDARFNGYFSGIRESMERAWVRPRLAGYIPFQHQAGEIVARVIDGALDPVSAIGGFRAKMGDVGGEAK